MNERKEAMELFINDFETITDCLYNSELRISKADEYYYALLRIKGYLEETLEQEYNQKTEIPEINIQEIEEIKFPDNTVLRDTRDLIVNQLVQAVKQLDKKIKEN